MKIFEGDQFRVGRIEFQGNDRTRDKVLRREFRVQEGLVINMGALKNSLFKLNQLDYFKLDEDDPIEFENIDSEKKTVDLTVQGKESDRTELHFGGGWSELDGFFGQFSMRTQNFLGRGENGRRLGADRQRAQTCSSCRTSSPGCSTGRSRWASSSSSATSTTTCSAPSSRCATSRAACSPTGAASASSTARGCSTSSPTSRTRSAWSTPTGATVTTSSKYSKSDIRPLLFYDSLDNRLEPTVGLRTSASLEYAGGPLGGDIDLWRPELAFTWFKPIAVRPVRSVFALNLAAGMVQEIGDTPLPLLERYYVGGARSLRGHASRSISLRDEQDNPVQDGFGNLLGGTSYLQLALEYHFLLGGPFRLVFFVDGGNVFGDEGLKLTYRQPAGDGGRGAAALRARLRAAAALHLRQQPDTPARRPVRELPVRRRHELLTGSIRAHFARRASMASKATPVLVLALLAGLAAPLAAQPAAKP